MAPPVETFTTSSPYTLSRRQDVDGSTDVRLQIPCRVGDRSAHVDLRSKVNDHLGSGALDHAANGACIADVHRVDARSMFDRTTKIFHTTGREVVYHHNLMSIGQQSVDEIGADEASSSGYENVHGGIPAHRDGYATFAAGSAACVTVCAAGLAGWATACAAGLAACAAAGAAYGCGCCTAFVAVCGAANCVTGAAAWSGVAPFAGLSASALPHAIIAVPPVIIAATPHVAGTQTAFF